MNTEQEHGEPERREGLGGRVRRFIDSEVNRALDKRDHGTEKVDTGSRDTPSRAPDVDRHHEPVTVPPEPVTPYDEQPGRPVHPVPPAPVDPGYDSPVHDSPVHDSATDVSSAHSSRSPAYDRSVEGARSGQIGGRSSEEAAADSSAERVGLLDDPAGLRAQWERVQGTFVDDPQRAVHEASVLVDRTLQEIHRNVTRGQTTNPTSTEDLRVSFHRYREFFQRLLSA
jgi:hypothetical protein